MGKLIVYCDAEKLEKAWFHLVIAEAVPILEPYRLSNCLLTKISGTVTIDGKEFLNPYDGVREHTICVGRGVHVFTNNGDITEIFVKTRTSKKEVKLPLRYNTSSQMRNIGFGTYSTEQINTLVEEGWYKASSSDRRFSSDEVWNNSPV